MPSTTPPEKTAIRELQAEVLSDTSGPLLVELGPGVEVRVLPPRMWRISGLRAIKSGDFDEWAKKCLASTEDYEAFADYDPTLEQVEAFMTKMNEATEGNSMTSSTSSRRSKTSRKR